MPDRIFVIAFGTTTQSMRAEAQAKERMLHAQMIPTPREITASCSLSLRFCGESEQTVREFYHFLGGGCELFEMKTEERTGLTSAWKLSEETGS